MKRLLLICMVLMLVTLIAPMSVYATTDIEKSVNEIAKQTKLVTDSVSIVYGDKAVVAIKTTALTRTEYWEIKTTIQDAIKSKFNDIQQVYITNNVRIYYTIEQLNKLPEDKRAEQLEKIMDKLSKIPMPYNELAK